MSSLPDTTHRSLPGGRPRDVRADPYLKSMLLGLVEDRYRPTGTFTHFPAEARTADAERVAQVENVPGPFDPCYAAEVAPGRPQAD